MTPSLQHRLDTALRIAREAGELALGHFRALELLSIESKGHQDLVSNDNPRDFPVICDDME